jgi:large subunit ribosomal protein L30
MRRKWRSPGERRRKNFKCCGKAGGSCHASEASHSALNNQLRAFATLRMPGCEFFERRLRLGLILAVTDNHTIYVKWVRSGIGFSHRQKGMIRSLGLTRLNQVVERPDTPQTRGLVGALAHLVAIVGKPEQPAWASVPEYVIRSRETRTVPPARLEGKDQKFAATSTAPDLSEARTEAPTASEEGPATVPESGSSGNE